MGLRAAAGLVVDSLNYGGLVDPWAAEGYQAASGAGERGGYVPPPGGGRGGGAGGRPRPRARVWGARPPPPRRLTQKTPATFPSGGLSSPWRPFRPPAGT